MRRDRDVSEAALVEMLPQQIADELGREVGHEPEVHLRARDGREDRLRALTLVAGAETADRARGLEEVALLERGPAQSADESVDPVDALPPGLIERQPFEHREVGGARGAD